MKITAATAKTRAAMEKQNARRTSRVVLLLESRVERNSNTHIIHPIAGRREYGSLVPKLLCEAGRG